MGPTRVRFLDVVLQRQAISIVELLLSGATHAVLLQQDPGGTTLVNDSCNAAGAAAGDATAAGASGRPWRLIDSGIS